MRKIQSSKHTEVCVMDEPGLGGANHEYNVGFSLQDKRVVLCRITFQNGQIQEAGVNGVMNEDLLAILIDRMRGFQSGNYSCRDNAIALTKLEEALMWLNKRTNERIARNVEGTSAV